MCISLHDESNNMLAGGTFQKVPEISGDEIAKVGICHLSSARFII